MDKAKQHCYACLIAHHAMNLNNLTGDTDHRTPTNRPESDTLIRLQLIRLQRGAQ